MSDGSVWDALERWQRTLFLGGGGVVVGFAALFAFEAVMDTMVQWKDLLAGIGYTMAFVGLLGFYPDLADQSPKLARVGAFCAAMGALGFTGVFALGIGQLTGIIPTPKPSWMAVINIPTIVGLIPGFFAMGVASLRTDVHSRVLGVLLLAPGILFSFNFVLVVTMGSANFSAWLAAAITLGEALALLGVGYLLRIGSGPTAHVETPTESTARGGGR